MTLPNPPGGHTAHGITLHDLESDTSDTTLITFGHHDKRRYFAACQHYMRDTCGWPNLDDDSNTTWNEFWADFQRECRHLHAQYVTAPDSPDDWHIEYAPEGLGTVPITAWEPYL